MRADEILTRMTSSHWEMDCVCGPKKGNPNKSTILVLTERKTRLCLYYLMPNQSISSVTNVLDSLEKRLGTIYFKAIFKTITVDNGLEFNAELIKKSHLTDTDRTTVYYCDPYSPWQRGSNENSNKLLRKWIPKYTDLGKYTLAQIKAIQTEVNNYPRKIFNYDSSLDKLLLENPIFQLAAKL